MAVGSGQGQALGIGDDVVPAALLRRSVGILPVLSPPLSARALEESSRHDSSRSCRCAATRRAERRVKPPTHLLRASRSGAPGTACRSPSPVRQVSHLSKNPAPTWSASHRNDDPSGDEKLLQKSSASLAPIHAFIVTFHCDQPVFGSQFDVNTLRRANLSEERIELSIPFIIFHK